MVDREHPSLSLVRQCALLGVSRSSLYYHPRAASAEDLSLMGEIDRQYLNTPFYSALARVRAAAAREQRSLPELTEQNNFLNVDIIVADMGDPDTRERRSPPVAYALFEASITADQGDAQRAADRARTLAQTMGVPITAAVIADSAPEPVLREAHATGVSIFLAADR